MLLYISFHEECINPKNFVHIFHLATLTPYTNTGVLAHLHLCSLFFGKTFFIARKRNKLALRRKRQRTQHHTSSSSTSYMIFFVNKLYDLLSLIDNTMSLWAHHRHNNISPLWKDSQIRPCQVPTICISVLLKTNGNWPSHTIYYCTVVGCVRT